MLACKNLLVLFLATLRSSGCHRGSDSSVYILLFFRLRPGLAALNFEGAYEHTHRLCQTFSISSSDDLIKYVHASYPEHLEH